jgi:RHS repeat-associated protein
MEYLGSLIYRRNTQGGPLTLESASFGSGRITVSETDNGSGGIQRKYTPNYFVTDHLGSTRVVVRKNTSGNSWQVLERNDYFPFGKRIDLSQGAITDNRFRFSNKEEQSLFNLPFVDFGARMYDPFSGRWITLDVLGHVRPWESPFLYAGGNPISRIDRDGKKWVDVNGRLMWENGGYTKVGMSVQNATLRRHMDELRRTVTGRQQFDKMIDRETPTEIKYGTLKRGTRGLNEKYANKVTGELTKYVVTLDIENIKDNAEDKAVTLDQAVASTLGHEFRHQEEENIEMYNQSDIKGQWDSPEEVDARKVGDKIINDYKTNNYYREENFNNSLWDSFKSLFDRLWQ